MRSWPRRSGCSSRDGCRSSSLAAARGPARPRSRTPCSSSCRPTSGSSSSRGRPRRSTGCRRRRSWAGGGRRDQRRRAAATSGPAVRPETAMLVVPEFSDHLPSYTWGEEARIAIRAATIGYGLAGHAPRRFARGRARGPGAPAGEPDRRRDLAPGRRADPAPPRVRRRPPRGRGPLRPARRRATSTATCSASGPAVLATWDAAGDRFEHFGWGITPELARRVGRRAGDFELEVDRRRDVLDGARARPASSMSTPCAWPSNAPGSRADPATVPH